MFVIHDRMNASQPGPLVNSESMGPVPVKSRTDGDMLVLLRFINDVTSAGKFQTRYNHSECLPNVEKKRAVDIP